MCAATYSLLQFVKDARVIVSQKLDEKATLEALTEPLRRVIARPECLADMEADRNPDPDDSFPIYLADDLSILAVVWRPNTTTAVHNHNGWALEGVISGEERNRNFVRLDDCRGPIAQLEEVAPTVVGPGQTTALDLPPNDIHAVEIGPCKTLTIHVYGTDIFQQARHVFDLETGEVKPLRSAAVTRMRTG